MFKKFIAAIAAVLITAGIAWAAGTTLSNLSASGAVADADTYYTVQTPGSGGVKATALKMYTYIASKLAPIASSGSASDLSTGTVPAARTPAYSGGCTTTAGSTVNTCLLPPSYYTVNNWYLFKGPTSVAGTSSLLNANTFYCTFHYIDKNITVSDVGAHVVTVGSTNVQYGLYAPGSDGQPGAKLNTTSSVANTSLGVRSQALAASVALGPNSVNGAGVWFCTNSGDSTAVYSAMGTTDFSFGQFVGAANADNLWNTTASSSMVMGLFCAGANCNGGSSTLGTWPSTLAGSTWSNIRAGSGGQQAVIGHFKVSSVP